MQLLFHLVYYHSTCFGHGSCPSSGVVYKTVEAATSVCQCVWGEVVLSLVVSVNVIMTSLKCVRSVLLCLVKNRKLLTCTLNEGRVSMRMMLCIGPPSYTILARS